MTTYIVFTLGLSVTVQARSESDAKAQAQSMGYTVVGASVK